MKATEEVQQKKGWSLPEPRHQGEWHFRCQWRTDQGPSPSSEQGGQQTP